MCFISNWNKSCIISLRASRSTCTLIWCCSAHNLDMSKSSQIELRFFIIYSIIIFELEVSIVACSYIEIPWAFIYYNWDSLILLFRELQFVVLLTPSFSSIYLENIIRSIFEIAHALYYFFMQCILDFARASAHTTVINFPENRKYF
jgi:hypothetical protein